MRLCVCMCVWERDRGEGVCAQESRGAALTGFRLALEGTFLRLMCPLAGRMPGWEKGTGMEAIEDWLSQHHSDLNLILA